MIVTRIMNADGVKLLDAIVNLTNKSVAVGWFEKSKYEDGTQVAGIAAQNEFGNPRKSIPARPFVRPAIAENRKKWEKLLSLGGKKIVKNELTINNVLDLLGHQVEGDIKESIKQVYSPALAESTVLRRIAKNKKLSSIKGRINEPSLGLVTKPLIDTGIMFNTVTHEIRDY